MLVLKGWTEIEDMEKERELASEIRGTLEVTDSDAMQGNFREEGVVNIKSVSESPGRRGSVGWVSSHKAKGHSLIPGPGTGLGCRLGPQPGYMQEATDGCFSLASMFLSLSLPSPLKINKCF